MSMTMVPRSSDNNGESMSATATTSVSSAPPLLFVTQNNRGLDFLKSGDIGQARKCFTDALRGAQMGLTLGGGGGGGGGGYPNNDDTNNDQEHPPQQHQQQAASEVSSPPPSSAQASSSSSASSSMAIREQLFSRLRSLPTSDLQDQALSIFMDTSQLSSANMALIYSVIIYNMGLVYHVRGRECRSISSSSSACALAKAVELYQKALSIVMVELEPIPPIHRNPIIDLLRMALLKHLADIHCTLSNYEMARAYGEELSSFITSVGCFVYRDPSVTDLMQSQVGCFLMYAFSLHQGSLLAPAA